MNRPWHILIISVLAALLTACGNSGKGAPPAEKKVVIGNAAQIKEKRLSTHHRAKPLPVGVTHQRFKDGKLLADDAPHPYTLSSGMVHVDPRRNKSLQITYHEDKLGTLSNEIPASFHISDTSIVDEVKLRPGTNQPIVSLTGKKGNSYITALDARGDAISKFMVLSAEPQEDVLVVDDPSIHPILCLGITVSGYDGACDADNATDFDMGHIGYKFSIDEFLNGKSTEKKIMLDDQGLEKMKALAGAGSAGFNKRAIYFESIDTLVVMNEGFTKISRQPFLNEQDRGKSPLDPSIRWYNTLDIHHVATQQEFDAYIDYGGKLTSSPLRDYTQKNILTYEVTPDRPIEGQLTGVEFTDGSRVSTSSETLQFLLGTSRYSVSSYVYQLREQGQSGLRSTGGFECRVSMTAGKLYKFGFTSFKSIATLTLGGDFNWNSGRPSVGLSLNPQVNTGGQLKFGLDGTAKLTCEKELFEVKFAEEQIPGFGKVYMAIPVPLKLELAVNASGDVVLALPQYDLGSPSDPSKPGKAGINYSVGGGFQAESAMKSSMSNDHVVVVEGTRLNDSIHNDSAHGKIGLEQSLGVAPGLVMAAEVNLWLATGKVEASLGEVLLGWRMGGSYDIDTAKKTAKVKSEGEAGFGAFASFSPTISIHVGKFFDLSFNLFSLDIPPWWWYKLPVAEEREEAFVSAEARDKITIRECVYGSTPCSDQHGMGAPTEYVNSSEKFTLTNPYDREVGSTTFTYAYVYKDKDSGNLRVKEVPMTFPDGQGPGKKIVAFKYGVTNVLAEAVYVRDDLTEKSCYMAAWGDKASARLFGSCGK
jgi:hypothetical protein